MTAISELSTPIKQEVIQQDVKLILASAPPCIPSIIDDLVMTPFLANLRPVLGSNNWIFDNRDMIKAWTIFKAKCAGDTIERGFSVRDDVQSIL